MPSLRLSFDPALDQTGWPGPLDGVDAVAGCQWLGPVGLLQTLETTCALRAPHHSALERCARLVPILQNLDGFWSRSAAVDTIATARRLLRDSDTLRLHGWQGQPVSERLEALAKVTSETYPGVPERLTALIAALEKRDARIETIEVWEPPNQLPKLWRHLFEALENNGTKIRQKPPAAVACSGCIKALANREPLTRADDSLQLVRPHGLMQAADAVASWIAAQPSTESIVVIGSDALLDAALERHGLPTSGASAPHHTNSILQILPLVLELGWKPADPERAQELLTLPASPIPRRVGRRLVRALQSWPAVGSGEWHDALHQALDAIEDPQRRVRVEQHVAVFLEPTVPRDELYPLTEIERRVMTLQYWLLRRRVAEETHAAAWTAALAQADGLLSLLSLMGVDALTAPQLRRLVDEATREVSPALSYEHRAGLGFVATPGALLGPVDSVVWWRFDHNSVPTSHHLALSADELSALQEVGCETERLSQDAIVQSARCRRPLQYARKRLLLVCPKTGDDGDELFVHPLWDEIEAAIPSASRRALVHALTSVVPTVGESAKDARAQWTGTPPACGDWTVLPEQVKKREVESPSSMGMLMGCSLQWVLRYLAHVIPGESGALPSDNILHGSVAHAIIGDVITDNTLSPEEAASRAERLFDERGPTMAAQLFLPGLAVERGRVRNIIRSATRELVRIIRDAGYDVTGIESVHVVSAFDAKLEGRLDIELGPSPALIDMKWGSRTRHGKALTAGTAYQLAAYSRALGHSKKSFPPVAYFILRDQQLLTNTPEAFGLPASEAGISAEQMWAALEAGYTDSWMRLTRGEVVAAGVKACNDGLELDDRVEDGVLRLAPSCDFCDFSGLCGMGFEGGN